MMGDAHWWPSASEPAATIESSASMGWLQGSQHQSSSSSGINEIVHLQADRARLCAELDHLRPVVANLRQHLSEMKRLLEADPLPHRHRRRQGRRQFLGAGSAPAPAP